MTTAETRTVTLTVTRVDDDDSKVQDGVMQWKTYADVPEFNSKYATGPLWVTGDRPTKGQTLKAKLKKENQKRDTDGSHDYDFFWGVAEWGVAATTTTAPAPTTSTQQAPEVAQQPQGNGANDIDRRRAEDAQIFRRKDAIKDAIAALASVPPEMLLEHGETLMRAILDAAQALYVWEPLVDHAQDPREPTTAPQRPVEAPETAQSMPTPTADELFPPAESQLLLRARKWKVRLQGDDVQVLTKEQIETMITNLGVQPPLIAKVFNLPELGEEQTGRIISYWQSGDPETRTNLAAAQLIVGYCMAQETAND